MQEGKSEIVQFFVYVETFNIHHLKRAFHCLFKLRANRLFIEIWLSPLQFEKMVKGSNNGM